MRTRGLVLDAAVELFNERGVAETSIATIAKRARVGVSSIYQHFPSKAALVDEVVGAALGRHASLFAAVGAGADPLQELRDFGRGYLEFAVAEPAAARALGESGHDPLGAEGHHVRGFLEEAVDRVERAVQTLAAQDGLDASRRNAATVYFLAVILGLADQVSRTDSLAVHIDLAQAALDLATDLAGTLAPR